MEAKVCYEILIKNKNLLWTTASLNDVLVGAYKECEVVYKIVPFHTDPAIKMWAIDFFLIGKFKFSKPSPIKLQRFVTCIV